MLSRRKMLGLAVTRRSITAVEVAPTAAGARISRAGELVLDDETSLEKPQALGKALKQFLHAKGFSASRCVIGMEANWLATREKTVPAQAGHNVGDMLALMVEREFASDRKDLVVDYALAPESEAQRSVLLVAAPRRVVDGLAAMAQAAGLRAAGITASTVALAAAGDGQGGDDQLVLHLFAGGAELAVRSGGALRMMRRLPVSIPLDSDDVASKNGWVNDLADELHRVVALLPGGTRPEASEVVVWDQVGLDAAACETMSDRLALAVRPQRDLPGLDRLAVAALPVGGQFSAAGAMAVEALRGRSLTVDLLHSRLAAQERLPIARKLAWAGGVAGALLVAAVAVGLDWRSDYVEAEDLDTRLQAMEGDLRDARATINRVGFARPWYDRRPKYLECVRELTLAFPQESGIWATSLAVQEDMQVALSGKATSKAIVLDVVDRLKANKKLFDVQPLYLREAGRSGRETAFAMSFTYGKPSKSWSSPSARKSLSRRR